MSGLTKSVENSLGLRDTAGSIYISAPSELLHYPELASVSHAIRHAWDKENLNLDGVICIDNQPAAYFRQQKTFTKAQKEKLVRFFWNHGTAAQLILISETKLEVFSSQAKAPRKKDSSWAESSLVETIEDLAEKLETRELYSFLKRLETGELYRAHREKFDSENAVDKSLLKNLHYLRDKLFKCGATNLESLHALLGRLLFICFLEARGFIGAKHFPGKADSLQNFLESHLSKPEKGISLLYNKLFQSLQKEFNGSLFSVSMDDEQAQLTAEGFAELVYFFRGDELADGQTVLPFSTYDFSVIPVETISAIYEDFLEAEDSKGKHEDGAYYTPRHLAELTVNLAVRDGDDVANWKFLDPSCGSGIFLVIAFNLLAEHWLFHGEESNSRRHKGTKINCLIDILCNQIRGVDKNPTACRIAAFSLYLALFEKIRPIDLDQFKEKVDGKPILPTLLKPTTRNTDDTAVITCSDFNELSPDFPRNFDSVIGNPPWLGKGSKQIALPFVNQAGDYLRRDGYSSFVLPTSMLVTKKAVLGKDWFLEHAVSDIVNLADYRRILFGGPELPSFIIRFSNTAPDPKNHTIHYYTPRMSRYDSRQGLIAIESDELKPIPQKNIWECIEQEDLSILWVSRFCGTQRDLNLIEKLRRMPKLGKILGKDNELGLKKGVGFKPFYRNETRDKPQKLDTGGWNLEDPYLPSSSLESLILDSDSWQRHTLRSLLSKLKSRKGNPASTTLLRTKPKKEIFSPPMVLLNEGFTKAAYCSGRIRFQHSIHSISGPSEAEPILKLLVALFSSELAQYFLFYCSSGWMGGRQRVHLEDKMLLPLPLPGSRQLGKKSTQALEAISSTFDKLEADLAKTGLLEKERLVEEAEKRLNEFIYQYYGINSSERILIQDTLKVWVPSVRKRPDSKNIPSLEQPKEPDIKAYAKATTQVINSWASATDSNYRIRLENTIRPSNNRLRLVVLKLHKVGEKFRRFELQEDSEIFTESLRKMEKALSKTDHPFQFLRGMTFFDGERILLLKPDTRRHWSRTSGLNDADEILSTLRKQFVKQKKSKK